VVPARHYVQSLQSIFLAGDYWPELLFNSAALLAVGVLFFAITLRNSHKVLD
jgi:ABC-2 type transport system permease protein